MGSERAHDQRLARAKEWLDEVWQGHRLYANVLVAYEEYLSKCEEERQNIE
jgi:hypothetical protein